MKYCAKPENIYYRALRQVFRELSRFFAAVCTCSLTLNSSGTILYCLLHVMSQFIKQLLTWYLTHDKVYEFENRIKNPSELENRAQEAPEHEN